VIPRFDLNTIRFGDAAYLWLLVLPASLLVLWGWRLWRRRRDVARLPRAAHRARAGALQFRR
jgi:hypothetical protein